jgi:hypothetical protein
MTSDPASDSSSQDPSASPFGLPRPVAWGGGLLLLALVVFGAGWMMGARPIDNLNRDVEQAEARAEANASLAEGLEARLNAHRALSLLYRTMLDVDARNFGTANQRLDEAAAALAQVDPNAIGPAATDLENLRRELGELDLRVAEDLAEQRGILSDLARRLAVILDA